MLFTSKHKGTHKTRRIKGRKWLGIPVAAWLIGIPTVALAVAGFIVLLGVQGTVSADNGIDVTYVVNNGVSPSSEGSGSTCSGSVVDPSTINITMGSLAGEGELCKYIVTVANTGLAAARLQGFNLDSADFAGGEITASVETCGVTIPAGGQTSVAFFLEAGLVSPGQTFTFVPAEDGLEWVTSAIYQPTQCVQF